MSADPTGVLEQGPKKFEDLPAAEQDVVMNAIAAQQHRPGALLPILHAVQSALGWVPPAAVAPIARALNQSRAEVQGVLSFYHDFRSAPPGRQIIKICRAEACQAMGADDLVAHAKRRLAIDFGETRADGAVTLEPVYCLGNCACAPAIMVDGVLYGRVSRDRFDQLSSGCEAQPAREQALSESPS
jgi:formate dehydrogenase subunit gamma